MWYFTIRENKRKLTLTSEEYFFVEKLKIVEKNLYKPNCYCGKVSHTLNSKQSNSPQKV